MGGNWTSKGMFNPSNEERIKDSKDLEFRQNAIQFFLNAITEMSYVHCQVQEK
jgi:hypothetical protein